MYHSVIIIPLPASTFDKGNFESVSRDALHIGLSVPINPAFVLSFLSSFLPLKRSVKRPLPISEDDVNSILNRIEVGEDAPAPKTIYEPGEVIRVCDGPFNDFNGVVENVDYERNMVKVSVQILGRATPVELDFMQIEKT